MGTELAERRETNVVRSEPTQILDVISRAASDPNVDIDKLERLMQMHERLSNRQAETEFNAALTAAQSEMGRVSADATNPQTRSKYASYAALDRALRPIYTRHGFALSFDEGESPKAEHVRVLCHVSHRSGFSRTYHKDMPADGKGAKGGDVMTKTHAAGSAMSYGMRYLLKGIFNVAVGEDDDDGNAASGVAGGLVTEEQVEVLARLLEKVTDEDHDLFFKWAKVEKLEDLPAKKFATCEKKLKEKQRAAS